MYGNVRGIGHRSVWDRRLGIRQLDSADRSLAVSTAAVFEDGAIDIGDRKLRDTPAGVRGTRDPHAGRTLSLQSIKAARLQLSDLA